MAEEAIKNELNCSICLDTYADPKILQCFHVYCQKCLAKLVMRDQQGQLSLSCPICHQVTPVPASGTPSLPSAFHINHLLEILDQLKNKEVECETASSELVDSKAEVLPSALCCSDHGEREVKIFCETCGELICALCAVKDGKHHGHDYKDVNESFERYKEEVTSSLEPLEEKMVALTKVLAELDNHSDKIAHQRTAAEAKIRESSKRLHDIISNRQDQLISELDQITRKRLKCLEAQRDQIETLQAQLSSCLEYLGESLKTETQQCEVLLMKTNIVKQVQELTSTSHPDIFTLSTEVDVMFSGFAEAAAVCETYGRVYAPDLPDPLKCVATGRGLKEGVVGERATALLEAITLRDEPCIEASVLMSFQIELVSEITGGKVLGSVKRSMEQRGQGQYMISYQPTVRGRHQLHIKVDDQHIRGSPFCVTVALPVEKLGIPVLTLSELMKPWGVAVNSRGEMVVPEFDAHCVSVFSPQGEKLRSFGTRGSDKGQFVGPSAVAVDGKGNLLVLDYNNHRIMKFTADGSFLEAVGSWGREPLQFNNPTGIAYSASNNNLLVTEDHRVQVMTPDLRFIRKFGKKGTGKGQFIHPCGIATDNCGRVYVADSFNHRIQVFTDEGKFLRMFGKKGAHCGELNWPWGVGVDASSLVYISESRNHRVSVFTSEGKFVTAFGSEGTGPEQFNHPCGLAVDDCGVVYVCDRCNHCLKLY